MRRMKAGIARLMIVSLTLGTMVGNGGKEAEAAKKPGISSKKVSIIKGKTKKVTLKNAKKFKITWKTANKKVATVKKSGTYGAVITAKKAGKTKVTATLKKSGKKTTLTCSVTVTDKKVKPTATPTVTPTATPVVTAEPQEEGPSLKKAYAGFIDNIGTSITYNQAWGENGQQLQDPSIMKIVDQQYNSITLENEMKPDSTLGSFPMLISVDEAKKMGYCLDGYKEQQVPMLNLENVFGAMEEAKKHGLRMRAHTLMWHQQTPAWFFKEGYSDEGKIVDKETMNARLEFFARTMVSQVCAKEKEMTGEVGSIVYCWDVVNEYIHRSNAPGSATWVSVYGDMGLKPSYVKDVFRYAYDELKKVGAQDKVTLFYNDYDTYFSVEDELALINFINEGEPEKICRGMGMQSHLDIRRPTIDEYKNALTTFLNAGLEVQITELDITINFDTDDTDGREPTFMYRNEKETNEDQAAYARELLKVIVEAQRNRDKSVNPKGITGITVWGVYDGISWRRDCKPLFFGKVRKKDPVTNRYVYSIQPKPSYYAFLEALS